jgi:hypothetical protein
MVISSLYLHSSAIVMNNFLINKFLGYWYQKEQIKKIKGRRVLQDYSHEKKIVYTPFLNAKLIKDLQNNPDPVFRWVHRYIRESGW